jgi:menaquinone reductase, molybdopterin-binding-like subunit
MELGRRAFVKFIAGAVGGSLLTPLPWKLADDTAIWSQNWSWRPSPLRGEVTKAATTCVLCAGGCGIRVHLVDKQRAILVQGNPDHPINAGGICPLGASALQYLYAPYRVKQPLKQTGKRGDPNGFKPISWDDALGHVHLQLTRLRSEGNAHGLACITGQGPSSMLELWRQFFAAYGSPNLFHMPSASDGQALAAAATLGQEAPLAFALERASYVLSFGANLAEGWGGCGRLQAAYGRWRQEAPGSITTKLVQVESRCSMTASKADAWLPVKPGTEAAVALGIAQVLIRDRLYDSGFVDNHSFGFEDWVDEAGKSRQGFKSYVLANYTPDKVAEISGVDEGKILELARELRAQKHALIVWGAGKGNNPGVFQHDLAFLALNVLCGNLGPDGLLSIVPEIPLGALPVVAQDALAEQGLKQPRLDLARNNPVPLPGNAVHAFLDSITSEAGYPIEVLLVHEANPAYSLQENHLFRAAAAKVGLVVSFSSFLDETAQQADLILPNHVALERYDDVCGLEGAPFAYYAVAAPVVPRQLNTMHTGEVLFSLAKSLGTGLEASLPWTKYQDYLQDRVKGLAGSGKGAIADRATVELGRLKPGQLTTFGYADFRGDDPSAEPAAKPDALKVSDPQQLWKKLASGMCWYDAPVNPLEFLGTPSRHYEFACQLLLKKGMVGGDDGLYLPHYRPLPPSGDAKEYPLLLITYQMLSLTDQYLANPPFMTKTLPDDLLKDRDLFVELHPQTANASGLKETDLVLLKTPQGEMAVRIHLTRAARPGVVFIAQGLGHTAYDEYIQGKGQNANSITEVQIDPITGLGTVWATRAQLRRA